MLLSFAEEPFPREKKVSLCLYQLILNLSSQQPHVVHTVLFYNEKLKFEEIRNCDPQHTARKA